MLLQFHNDLHFSSKLGYETIWFLPHKEVEITAVRQLQMFSDFFMLRVSWPIQYGTGTNTEI